MKKIVGILVCILMIVSSFITVSSAKIETPNNILNTIKVNENTNNPPEITSIEYRGTIKYDKDIGLYLCEWKVYFYDPDGDYVTLFFKTNDSGNWDYRPHNAHLVDHFFFSWWIELGTYTAYFYVEDVIGLKSDTISYTYDVTKTKSINQNSQSVFDSQKLDKSETPFMANKNKIFIFGTIYNFTIDEPTKTYSFVCKNIWVFFKHKFIHITDHVEFINENLSFRGILMPWFVCGYFYW